MEAKTLYEEDEIDGKPCLCGEGVELANGTVIMWTLDGGIVQMYPNIKKAREHSGQLIEFDKEE